MEYVLVVGPLLGLRKGVAIIHGALASVPVASGKAGATVVYGGKGTLLQKLESGKVK